MTQEWRDICKEARQAWEEAFAEEGEPLDLHAITPAMRCSMCLRTDQLTPWEHETVLDIFFVSLYHRCEQGKQDGYTLFLPDGTVLARLSDDRLVLFRFLIHYAKKVLAVGEGSYTCDVCGSMTGSPDYQGEMLCWDGKRVCSDECKQKLVEEKAAKWGRGGDNDTVQGQ